MGFFGKLPNAGIMVPFVPLAEFVTGCIPIVADELTADAEFVPTWSHLVLRRFELSVVSNKLLDTADILLTVEPVFVFALEICLAVPDTISTWNK